LQNCILKNNRITVFAFGEDGAIGNIKGRTWVNKKCNQHEGEDQYKSKENRLTIGFLQINVVTLQSKRKEDGIRL